jgi:hypothetical protein
MNASLTGFNAQKRTSSCYNGSLFLCYIKKVPREAVQRDVAGLRSQKGL